jgi:DNA-binding response OmpR family regulator
MSARIVVCDDSPVILKPIEFKLKGAGYEVFAADDGEQGWDFVSRSPICRCRGWTGST